MTTLRPFVLLQFLLPKQLLTAALHWLARVRCRRLQQWLIRGFMAVFKPNLEEAARPDPRDYATFAEFFTRGLRPGARPLDADQRAVLSPCDGRVSECGAITAGRLLQAKGRLYGVNELLAGDTDLSARFEQGTFITIYLAPFDYHRVHMPRTARLLRSAHVPGQLFSVNARTAATVPRLFARNERLIFEFAEADGSRFVMLLVGALNVGSMESIWHGELRPRGRGAAIALTSPAPGEAQLNAGDEMGRFNFGSTVICLFEPGAVALDPQVAVSMQLRMGQRIGRRTHG
ncbi:MAG: archaetidylserine decarboxylase [Steroidobacteraceae bacterium]